MSTLAITVHIPDGRLVTGVVTAEARISSIDPHIITAIEKVCAASDRLDRDMNSSREQEAMWNLHSSVRHLKHLIQTKGL